MTNEAKPTLSPKGEAPVAPSLQGGEAEPVAWRYRDAWGRWAYCHPTDNAAGPKVITEKQPIYAHPSAQPKADREAIARIIVDRTGAGTLGLTHAASMAAALPLADEIIAALTTQGDAG